MSRWVATAFLDRISYLALWLLLSLGPMAMVPVLAFQETTAEGLSVGGRVDVDELRAHVTYLASEELEGRGPGKGCQLAREYVVTTFRDIGLEPAGGDGYEQAIDAPYEDRNVLGKLPGSDPDLAEQVLIISAHHDHLGKSNGMVYFGADDNATGVAALLEMARILSEEEVRPRRSLLFVSFGLEERRLLGSRHFVSHPTIPLDKIALCVNMDMLGRDLGNFMDGYTFVLGAEYSPLLKRVVREAAKESPLHVALFGTDVIGTRGDYGPFRDAKIPYLFFSTGEHPDYHQPTDTVERIMFDKLRANTNLLLDVVIAVANDDERPSFSKPVPDIEEVRALAGVLDLLIGKADKIGLDAAAKAFLGYFRGRLQPLLSKGTISDKEREQVVEFVHQMMKQLSQWVR